LDSTLFISFITQSLGTALAICVSVLITLIINVENRRRSLIRKVKAELPAIKETLQVIGSRTSDVEIIGRLMFNYSLKVNELSEFVNSKKPNLLKRLIAYTAVIIIAIVYVGFALMSLKNPTLLDYTVSLGFVVLLMIYAFYEIYKDITAYWDKLGEIDEMYLDIKNFIEKQSSVPTEERSP